MSNQPYYDIIIIGSGISGLYAAYNISTKYPDKSFIVLEKHKKQWIGGRSGNEMFYGAEIVTGAGIGRKKKYKLLIQLLKDLHIDYKDDPFTPNYSNLLNKDFDVNKKINELKRAYPSKSHEAETFQEFAKTVLGEKDYKQFLIHLGYTDYKNEDVYEVLYNYGLEDNTTTWKALHIPWKELIFTLCEKIGMSHVKPSTDVTGITKIQENPSIFLLKTAKGHSYTCNKVIVATTITSIRKLLPNKIYQNIEGQPFLRLYGKFSKKSIPIMQEYVKGYTIVPGPLQKIIPMSKGVYMIAYSDNENAKLLKSHLENNHENRTFFCRLIEKSLGIQKDSLELISIKDFYWPVGTHYYTPLDKSLYESREEFIDKAQHPANGILVIGEVVSDDQGWTEGALSSVKVGLTKKWMQSI